MKFLVHIEFCPEDTDKVIAKMIKNAEIREKDPDYYPKHVIPTQFTGNGKGFAVVEVTDPDQLARSFVMGMPEITWKFVACDDFSKWVEAYQESKKKT
jgi:hypothetical protein